MITHSFFQVSTKFEIQLIKILITNLFLAAPGEDQGVDLDPFFETEQTEFGTSDFEPSKDNFGIDGYGSPAELDDSSSGNILQTSVIIALVSFLVVLV